MATSQDFHFALQLPIEDGAMRAYLQRYPFSDGPDKEMNARCEAAVLEKLNLRPGPGEVQIRTGSSATVRLSHNRAQLDADVMDRLFALMNKEQISERRRNDLVNDYAWEVSLVPPGVVDVLSIGCGIGDELLFLRALLPGAKLTAIDYGDTMSEARKKHVGVNFIPGDMDVLLPQMHRAGRGFDLIFSNHTLEHLYKPDEIIEQLALLLRPKGHLVSTLPMDGMVGRPFLAETQRIVGSKKIHPFDLVFSDAGHPWKTNFSDLQVTFLQAGFAEVELYQRAEHLSRYQAGTEQVFMAKRARGEMLNAAVFGMPRALGKALLGKRGGTLAAKLLLAAERRVWFGSNPLKNRFAQEVCVVARR